jgi:hypothetical protein
VEEGREGAEGREEGRAGGWTEVGSATAERKAVGGGEEEIRFFVQMNETQLNKEVMKCMQGNKKEALLAGLIKHGENSSTTRMETLRFLIDGAHRDGLIQKRGFLEEARAMILDEPEPYGLQATAAYLQGMSSEYTGTERRAIEQGWSGTRRQQQHATTGLRDNDAPSGQGVHLADRRQEARRGLTDSQRRERHTD